MIPSDYIAEWRAQAPWATDSQVEQDLILSRAVVAMYSEREVARGLAFRGATALYKLYLHETVVEYDDEPVSGLDADL